MSLNLLAYQLAQLKFSEDPQDTFVKAPLLPLLFNKTTPLGNLFKNNQLSSDNLQISTALENIKNRFWKEIEKIEKASKDFTPLLMQKIKKISFDQTQLEDAEAIILIRCLWLHTFMLDVVHEAELPYLNLLYNHSEDKKKELIKVVEKALLCKRIKDFEIVTEKAIPFPLLFKLSQTDDLNDDDERELKSWLEQIENSKEKLLDAFVTDKVENSYAKTPFIHKLLRALFIFYNENCDPQEQCLNLGRLEDRLEKKGLPFSTTSDPKVILQRAQYVPGYTFKMSGQEFEIEAILFNPENDPYQSVIYSIKDRPDLELIFYINKALPFLENYAIRVTHCGPKIYKVYDSQEAMLIRERLYGALNTISWVSTYDAIDINSDPVIAKEDQEEIESIKDLIIGLLNLQITPYELTPSNFAYNYEKALRATKIMTPCKKSLEAIQLFAFKCACGDQKKLSLPIIAYLMHQTGLVKHFKEYHDLVQYTLEGQKKMIDLNKKIKNKKKLKIREEFYNNILTFQSELLEKLKKSYPATPKLKKLIDQAIIDVHNQFCPGSLLIPDFGKLIEAKALQSIQNEKALVVRKEQDPALWSKIKKKLSLISSPKKTWPISRI